MSASATRALGSKLAAVQKQKGSGTVVLSIFIFTATHNAIATFNTLIACDMFSQYGAALMRLTRRISQLLPSLSVLYKLQ